MSEWSSHRAWLKSASGHVLDCDDAVLSNEIMSAIYAVDKMEAELETLKAANRIMKEALEKYEKMSVRYDCPQNTAHLKPGDFVKIECGEIAREALAKCKELEK